MESIPESTPKAEQKLEIVDTLDYELNGEKDIFKVKVVKNEKKIKLLYVFQKKVKWLILFMKKIFLSKTF